MTSSESAKPFAPTPGSRNPFRGDEEARTRSGRTRLPQCSLSRPTIGRGMDNGVGTLAGRKDSDPSAVKDTVVATISEKKVRNTSLTQKGDSIDPPREYAQYLSSWSPQLSVQATSTCIKPSELSEFRKRHANHVFLPDRRDASTIHPPDEGTTQSRPLQGSRSVRILKGNMGSTTTSPGSLNALDPGQTEMN
jgi:hypothetical protein